jgi:hypothetical protein
MKRRLLVEAVQIISHKRGHQLSDEVNGGGERGEMVDDKGDS